MKGLCALALLCSLLQIAYSQVPNTVSYQGLLTTSAGTPLPDGIYKLQFDLYTDSLGGISFWTEVDSGLSLVRGAFSATLGARTALPDSFHRPLYIEVSALTGPGIGAPVTFTPRSGLTSTPFALSLRLPFTGRARTGAWGSTLSIYNDSTDGLAIYAKSPSPGFANIGALNGVSTGSQANGVYGEAVDGNQSWGTYGASDSGAGAAGVAFKQNGIGVYGFNSYHGGGIGLYSYGKLWVDSPPGDSSVVLPQGSVSSAEILDEPGIANGRTFGYNYIPVSTTIASDSITISTPGPGYVVVDASGLAYLPHTSGTVTNVWTWIDESAVSSSYYGVQFCYVDAPIPTGTEYQNFHCHWVFYESTAGRYNFYLKAGNLGGSASNAVGYTSICGVYYPTAYGGVSSIVPASEASAYPNARVLRQPAGTSQALGVPNSGGMYEVDLSELELRASKLRAGAEQAERQLFEARNAKAAGLARKHDTGNPHDH